MLNDPNPIKNLVPGSVPIPSCPIFKYDNTQYIRYKLIPSNV